MINHNPISDTVQFLLQPAWTTAIFWLLLLGSIAVAVHVYRTMPEQRKIEHVGNWVFRLLIGYVVAADPVEIAAVLYRPSGAAVRRDGAGLLDERDGPVRGDPLAGRFRRGYCTAAFLSVRTDGLRGRRRQLRYR